jgi:hypothetical protein
LKKGNGCLAEAFCKSHKEDVMQEMTMNEVALVGGGVMSTATKVEIGIALAVCPLLGLGMLAGYYANAK